jgi:transcriptional regulator with PAS, ATPase and Fis domain
MPRIAPSTSPKEHVLLSFTGFHDPFASTGVAGTEQEGPVLSLVRLRKFDRVYLFSTPKMVLNTDATVAAIGARYPAMKLEAIAFAFADPTDYFAILAALRESFKRISAATSGAEYYIATASGTPQMHACWLLLAASGEIPARLLQTHNTKFVTDEDAAVTEVDLTRPEFPHVRSNSLHDFELDEEAKSDAMRAVKELQIIGDHELMKLAVQRAITLGPFDIPVLITGESGTGKEKIAQLIHRASGRKGHFIAVNCAGVPEQLAESMLFGHVKGAFTSATGTQTGKLEQADGGTLLLDELGELSLSNQARLLRSLQEKMVEPVGAARPKKIDCRVIAATNVNLQQAVAQKRFREDLYYRIAAAAIELPPLRARKSDIPKLALYFVDDLNQRYRFKKPKTLAPETLALLMSYDWPGNVRELANVITNAAIQAVGGKIEPKHLALRRTGTNEALDSLPDPHEGFSLDSFLGRIRGQLYDRALELSGGNASKAAKLLGLTPQAVLKFVKTRPEPTEVGEN